MNPAAMIRNYFVITALVFSAQLICAADVTLLTGKKVSGQPTRLENGVLTVQAESGPVSVPVKDLYFVDFGNKSIVPAGQKYDDVTLTDGSVIRVSAFKIKGKQFDGVLLSGPSKEATPIVAVMLNKIFHILRGADQPKNQSEWAKLVAARGKRDLFVSRSAEGVLSPLPGTVLEGSAEGDSVTFEREDGQVTPLQLRRATGGIIFNQPPIGVVPPTLCKVVDCHGNELFAQSVEFIDGGMKVKTIHGAAMTYSSLSQIIKLDFSQGNIVYLSDIDPVVSAPKPNPGEPFFTYLRDKNQDNAPIRLGGISYARGLWIAPETALVYKLPSDFREFKTIIGVDDGIEVPSSKVKLTIEGDGRVLFSSLVARKDPPKELTLDVKGVREIRIAVEQDNRFSGNQVNLADVRLQK